MTGPDGTTYDAVVVAPSWTKAAVVLSKGTRTTVSAGGAAAPTVAAGLGARSPETSTATAAADPATIRRVRITA